MAWTWKGRGVRPEAMTWWPIKLTEDWVKEHFLGLTRIPTISYQEREELVKMIEMLLKGGAGHQNVIQINKDEGNVMDV